MSLYLLSGAVCRRSTPMSFYHAYSIVSSFLTNLDQQWKDLQQQCLNTTVIYMYVRILYFKYESFPFELYNAYIRINSMSKHAKKTQNNFKKACRDVHQHE